MNLLEANAILRQQRDEAVAKAGQAEAQVRDLEYDHAEMQRFREVEGRCARHEARIAELERELLSQEDERDRMRSRIAELEREATG